MKKNKGLFLIISGIILLIIIAGFFYATRSGKGQSAGAKENAANTGEEKQSDLDYGFEYGSRSELILSLAKGLFSVGSPETVAFTVQCPEESETVRILDEDNQELVAVETKGRTLVTGSLVIDESEPRFGSLHAVSGELESQEVYFTVAPEITDDMVETLVDVCTYIRDYLGEEYPNGVYTDDMLIAVQKLLEEDGRVESSTIDDQTLLFSTMDGLMGMVDLSEEEGLTRGGVTAEQAYALSREGLTDKETVIPVRPAVTNSRYLYLSPTSDDVIMKYGDIEPRRSMEHTASVFTADYEVLEDANAEAMLRDGSLTDAGFLVLSCHGNTLPRSNGGRILLMTIRDYADEIATVPMASSFTGSEKKEKTKSLALITKEDKTSFYGSSKKVENCNSILCVKKLEEPKGKYRLEPRFTATGLENGIGEKLFDNTVIYMEVCHSDEDAHLLQFLADHGASVIFTGVEVMEVTRCSEVFYMIDTLMTKQGDDGSYPSFEDAELYPTQEELRAFRKKWDGIDGNKEVTQSWQELMQDPEGNKSAILQKIKYIATEHQKAKDEEHKKNKTQNPQSEYYEILNWLACRNFKEMWLSINRSYEEFCKEEEYKEVLDEAGESPETIMRDYIKGNMVRCHIYAKGKALGGTGTLQGNVLSKKSEKPVEDAEVLFLRWIDHDYREVAACKTDAEGHYMIDNLPYGIYAVKASKEKEEAHVCLTFTKEDAEVPDLFLTISDEDLYYSYLNDTYGTGESDLVSAYIMDFDLDGRKDLLTVTKGRVILANTPLGAFDLYDGETEAATLDLTMYQLDEENHVVKTGAILGAGTIEGHSEGKMSVSIVLQDGKPYICGYSENEDNTTYGARPYVIYEVIEGGGFQYDYVDGISWGQYVMGTTDNKDPNKVAKTYGLDITGTQLSDRANYGVVLCEATANNRQGPGPIVANDYTGVKEGMENGYEAVKNQLDAIHELMALDAETFKERQESAKDTEGLFEIFASELSAAGITPVLKEYRTKEDIVLGIYKCQDVDMYVSIENGSGKLTEIELMADGFPVPDSWYPVKDAVLTSSFAGLDQTKIGEVLGHTPANFSVYGLDAGPAKILAGNTDTIVLRISY